MKRPKLPNQEELQAMPWPQLCRVLRAHSRYWQHHLYSKPEHLPVGEQVAYRVLTAELERRGEQLLLY